MTNLKTLFLILLFFSNYIFGWVYPEHREISLIAIQKLSPEDRALLNSLWKKAIKDHEDILSPDIVLPYQFRNPKYIDYAAWAAIAGDHSCSAYDMLYNILESDWILEVADITAKLRIDLISAGSKKARLRLNALRDSDLLLQRADPEYATRAGSNNVHFLLSLQNPQIKLEEFIDLSYKEGAELNAVAAYAYYHYSALLKASHYYKENLNDKEISSLLLAAFADEAYALHFLQDIFAAGHVAGTWGDASLRKGTHDYYNERGLKTVTWKGESIVITGDAYMRKEDGERAAEVVMKSLEQLIEALSGNKDYQFYNENIQLKSPLNFNTCTNNFMPEIESDLRFKEIIVDLLIDTPKPGLSQGIGELPRFRAELGLFGGIAPSVHGSLISGGFSKSQKNMGMIGGIEASVKIGLGLDGVLNDAGDGLVFFGLGWREDGASSTGFVEVEGIEKYGNLLAAIPGRSAFTARLRLPFYLLPLDLLIVGPFVYLISPKDFGHMAVMSANGGLIPWHLGIGTSIGRFQFVLGREFGLNLFGRSKTRDALIFVDLTAQEQPLTVISYRSTQIEFPILEFRPSKAFAFDQSSTLLFQFFGGVDIPSRVEALDSPDIPTPKLENIWFWGMRLIFDWRHYF